MDSCNCNCNSETGLTGRGHRLTWLTAGLSSVQLILQILQSHDGRSCGESGISRVESSRVESHPASSGGVVINNQGPKYRTWKSFFYPNKASILQTQPPELVSLPCSVSLCFFLLACWIACLLLASLAP
ncbi:hypothetical protein BO94DRAFT_310032 [Aspergillus sclerotioniger CBS 115572]|uniref:Uncharacterized protein n=1 Tax=Aspergillus sclerotioniger CBS 115572 TaxID=1450535 RepID=A0A317V2K3_9EURO|nr:hypothetical protein BO94DRAFT_310032 [Aspergillus sclerotioniger CBS 115572]PWY67278.1 hypothetical protein BO94DRAFT_310032 [Aspergillus sclerotioniger CBS 115572]